MAVFSSKVVKDMLNEALGSDVSGVTVLENLNSRINSVSSSSGDISDSLNSYVQKSEIGGYLADYVQKNDLNNYVKITEIDDIKNDIEKIKEDIEKLTELINGLEEEGNN